MEGRPEGEGAGVEAVVKQAVAGVVRVVRGADQATGPAEPLLSGEGGSGDAGAASEREACLRLRAAGASPSSAILLVAGAAKAFPAGPAAAAAGGSAATTTTLTSLLSPASTIPALRGAWLHAAPGECVGVVGSNGAGKTTLFRLVVGELEPDAGCVLVGGVPAAGGRGRCGYCPQGASLHPDLSSVEAVASLALLRGVRKAQAGPAATALLSALGLPAATAARPLSTLSGGQARRAGVAAALIGSPSLVVLDEPSTGLDAAARARLWATVRGVCGTASAVLVSSHRLDELDAVCGRVGVLEAGGGGEGKDNERSE
jgi:ABC-type Mn2+/Zn2+ transport system ATPase subunit